MKAHYFQGKFCSFVGVDIRLGVLLSGQEFDFVNGNWNIWIGEGCRLLKTRWCELTRIKRLRNSEEIELHWLWISQFV